MITFRFRDGGILCRRMVKLLKEASMNYLTDIDRIKRNINQKTKRMDKINDYDKPFFLCKSRTRTDALFITSEVCIKLWKLVVLCDTMHVKYLMEDFVMALIKCPECGKEISDKAINCPNCGFPINQVEVETEQDRIIVRGKNRGKNFLIFGGILFLVSMVFYIGTSDVELGLRAKKLTVGLYGSEVFEWLFLRYTPDLLLWVSIILVVIGMIFLVTSNENKSIQLSKELIESLKGWIRMILKFFRGY